ncbi:MAG: hypothetical protein ACYCSN_20945 [Acidobacteriaceae bacterium]
MCSEPNLSVEQQSKLCAVHRFLDAANHGLIDELSIMVRRGVGYERSGLVIEDDDAKALFDIVYARLAVFRQEMIRDLESGRIVAGCSADATG